jgi:GTPase SAR1 family protein
MEKTVYLKNVEICFNIWDLAGQREFLNMLPLICNDALAIFFMFDLTRKSTLIGIKEWYRQVRGLNRVRFKLFKILTFIIIHVLVYIILFGIL